MPRLYHSRYNLSRGRNHRSTYQPSGPRRYFVSGYNDLLRRLASLHEYGYDEEEEAQLGCDRIFSPHRQTRGPKPDPADKEVIKVEKVDFLVESNTRAHRTDEFEICTSLVATPQLVVRRGQSFDIALTFSRSYDSDKDDLRLVFQAGEDPMPSKDTHVEFILSDKDEPKKWGAKIKNCSGSRLTVTVFTPPTCFVGKWKFKVDVVKKKDENTAIFRYNHKEPIYILFNPWCKDDTVFVDDGKLLQEYILNEQGKIYAGTTKKITAKPWNFGQFQGDVLDASLYLLDISGMNWGSRGNPIPVVRKISAMINAPDDGGVLVGNWSGDYSGGTSPLAWTGSEAILSEFYRNKKPVQFGQCWVFSGVTTTVCRALGIPARSVTNFASAHDTDGSITIDVHFMESGEADDERNFDSVWNFHVWNEVWMARPDLPKGYGGWQAIDSTPQETSDGMYCCGPASVNAIKHGEVNLPYDAPFVFAEVNADKVYWMCWKSGRMDNCHVEKQSVGKNISTKAPGSNEREDLTRQYKYTEDSPEERVAVLNANQVGSARRDIYKSEDTQDVVFELEDPDVFVGQDVIVTLKMTNKASTERYVEGSISALSMFYTGVPADLINQDSFKQFVKPGGTARTQMTVSADCYDNKLKDYCMIRINVMAKVKETGQIFTTQDEVRLRKPHLTIKPLSEAKVNQPFEVEVSFVNQWAKTLTSCYLMVEGPGLQKPTRIPQPSVPAKGTFHTKVELTPKKAGDREIIISLNSKELEDINGSCTIQIKK